LQDDIIIVIVGTLDTKLSLEEEFDQEIKDGFIRFELTKKIEKICIGLM